jgi:hypothetical protein
MNILAEETRTVVIWLCLLWRFSSKIREDCWWMTWKSCSGFNTFCSSVSNDLEGPLPTRNHDRKCCKLEHHTPMSPQTYPSQFVPQVYLFRCTCQAKDGVKDVHRHPGELNCWSNHRPHHLIVKPTSESMFNELRSYRRNCILQEVLEAC